jgi:hypothetical protein
MLTKLSKTFGAVLPWYGSRVFGALKNGPTLASGSSQSHFVFTLQSTAVPFESSLVSRRCLHSLANMLPINKLVKETPTTNGTSSSSIGSTGQVRLFSTESEATTQRMYRNYEEFEKSGRDFQVAVPWGHIACREFGKPGAKPVLMTHGWLDNLVTWSQLVPELLRRNPNLHIVTFDEPGCGLSTAKPKGMYYEALGTVVDMRRIAKHMKWDNEITLIGHSKGSFYSFIYASLYPDNVTQLISCDLIGPEINMSREVGDHIDQRIAMDLNFVEDPSGKRFNKVYTYEKAVCK